MDAEMEDTFISIDYKRVQTRRLER